jgi:uncharacterized membrane protein HdeD (DUF308 family)
MHRVGTLTLGVCLIIFGLLFIIKLFIPEISYRLLVSLWPVILVILGAEVIAAYILQKEDRLRYDGPALFLIFMLTCFSIAMACFEFLLHNAGEAIRIIT